MKVLKILLPVAIVAVAAALAFVLVRTRPEVEARKPEVIPPLVRVATVEPRDVALDVAAQGSVSPRIETTLVSRVAGQIVEVSPSFVVGGFFRRDEVLVELDRRDYELAIDAARSRVAQAELRLVREEAEAAVAREEWQELGEGEPDALVLREPQLAEARAALAAARADLERSELDLERTRIAAPFEGRLASKRVDLGQYLTPGQAIAGIQATDHAEIRLPVGDDQLAFLDLPLVSWNGQAPGPEVVLWQQFAGREHRWRGQIVRTEGEFDRRTRMLNLVARVDDPYGLEGASERPPLVVGAFVDAQIAGRVVPGAVVLPRTALRSGEGDRVLVVDGEERLRWRPVEVVRAEGDSVVLSGGLEAGERVCISPLDYVVDGMKVRTVDGTEAEGVADEAQPVDVEGGEL